MALTANILVANLAALHEQIQKHMVLESGLARW
jgi:hypothetical protein